MFWPASCDTNPSLIEYEGHADADSIWHSSHGAANAFKPQTNNLPYASAQNQVPATVWYRFNDKKVVSRISITSRKSSLWGEQSPKSITVVASDDCIVWNYLGYWDDLGFSAPAQTKTINIPCDRQGSYQCYGIKTIQRRGGCGVGCGCVSFVDVKMYG